MQKWEKIEMEISQLMMMMMTRLVFVEQSFRVVRKYCTKRVCLAIDVKSLKLCSQSGLESGHQ